MHVLVCCILFAVATIAAVIPDNIEEVRQYVYDVDDQGHENVGDRQARQFDYGGHGGYRHGYPLYGGYHSRHGGYGAPGRYGSYGGGQKAYGGGYVDVGAIRGYGGYGGIFHG